MEDPVQSPTVSSQTVSSAEGSVSDTSQLKPGVQRLVTVVIVLLSLLILIACYIQIMRNKAPIADIAPATEAQKTPSQLLVEELQQTDPRGALTDEQKETLLKDLDTASERVLTPEEQATLLGNL